VAGAGRTLSGALLSCALLFACGDAEEEPTLGSGGSATPPPDALAAVGYVGADEGADRDVHGVTVHDPARTQPGLTLYGDEHRGRVVALDLDGDLVREWRAPESDRVELGVPLPGGRTALLATDLSVSVVEADSAVVWRTPLSGHHDLWPLADGGLLVPVHTERDHQGRRVRFDAIARLDAEGEVVERLDLYELRDALARLHDASPLDEPQAEASDTVYDYYHLNTVTVVPADSAWCPGAWLLCLRNVDLVLALDPVTREVLWSYGPGELEAPHHPTITPQGRVLIFDNGRRRGWSRVVEVAPETGEVVWEYRAEGFFSDVRGAAQRLANGNTLITESERGRVFEVTREGEVVWEWWNPAFDHRGRRRVYRATRVPE